jgi:hypothetical protein
MYFFPGLTCKARWNNIRDNYRKSLKKRVIRSGQVTTKVKKYKYSEQLSFLNNYFQERETKGNIETQAEADDDEQTQDIMERENENFQSQITDNPQPITDYQNGEGNDNISSRQTPRKSAARRTQPQETAATTLMKYIIHKNETMPTLIHPVDAFLAVIAPTLKTLSPYYLNLAKSKIFATVQEYEMAMLMQEGQGPTYENRTEPTLLLATNPLTSSHLYHTSSSTTPSSYTAIQSPPEPPKPQ